MIVFVCFVCIYFVYILLDFFFPWFFFLYFALICFIFNYYYCFFFTNAFQSNLDYFLFCVWYSVFVLRRISECTDSEAETVMQLRSDLRDKEMKLTDIRLEALSSAHQLDQLRESMNRMQVSIFLTTFLICSYTYFILLKHSIYFDVMLLNFVEVSQT